MKKNLFIPFFTLALIFSSCDKLGEIIPDVDEVLTETYEITISEDMGTGADESSSFDITDYEEYQSYSEYIDDYLINKVSYEILNYTAPGDLYFSGSIKFYEDDANDMKTLGEIELISLSEIAESGEEQELTVDNAAALELITLLKEKGTFNLQFSYEFKNANGEPYPFTEQDYGTGFDLKTNLYITMITGAGDSQIDFNLK